MEPMIARALEVWRSAALQEALRPLLVFSSISAMFWLLARFSGALAYAIARVLPEELGSLLAVFYNLALALLYSTLMFFTASTGRWHASAVWREACGFAFLYVALGAAYMDRSTRQINAYAWPGYVAGLSGYLLLAFWPSWADQPLLAELHGLLAALSDGGVGYVLTALAGLYLLFSLFSQGLSGVFFSLSPLLYRLGLVKAPPIRLRARDGASASGPSLTAALAMLAVPVALAAGACHWWPRLRPLAPAALSQAPAPEALARSLRRLLPGQGRPRDFDAFWDRTLRELAAVPLDLKLREAAEQSDARVKCYQADYQSLKRIRIHAWYCRPAAEGRYPAVLVSPWYGRGEVAPPREAALQGLAVLEYQGRGFAVDLSSYPAENSSYILSGIESPDSYVFRELYAHAKRGVDVLASRPEVDARRIGATGMSQGGGLSLAAAGLDARVSAVSAGFPFLCGVQASLSAARGPYQELRAFMERGPAQRRAAARTLAYFDVLNFAPRIKAAALVQAGLRDRTCPAAGIREVYGRLAGPKVLAEFPAADHMDDNVPRWEKLKAFLIERLGARAPGS